MPSNATHHRFVALLFYYSSSVGVEAWLPWFVPVVCSPFRQHRPRTTLKTLSCPSHTSHCRGVGLGCLRHLRAWFTGAPCPAVSLGATSSRLLSCSNPLGLEMGRSKRLGSDQGPQTFTNGSLKPSRCNATLPNYPPTVP